MMSFRMSICYEKKASQTLMEKVKAFYTDAPLAKKGWVSYFDIWSLPEASKELEDGVKDAIQKLDLQAKGWKPVAEGKETHYGMQGDHEDIEFWYSRHYTK